MKFKHRKPRPEVHKPAVEDLLQEAHDSFDRLRILRARVAVSGIEFDALPDDVALRAFAVLGNHGRTDVVSRISPHLAMLIGKGLIANTDIKILSTPALRFFAQIEHLLDGVLDISQRIEAGIAIAAWRTGASTTDGPAIRCTTQAAGFYGQELRLRIHVSGAEWLLVRPAPIFDFAESLLRVDVDCAATIPLPSDDGEILIAAMSSSGQVTVRTVSVSVLREAA